MEGATVVSTASAPGQVLSTRYALSIVPYSPDRAEDVARIFCAATADHPYCGVLTADLVRERLCAPSYFDPAALLLAYRGGRPVGYAHGAFGKPRDGESAPNLCVGNVRGLFFPPDDVAAGKALLDELVGYFRSRGAEDLQGWGSFAGYPFYRGLYVGTEPVAAASHAHVLVRFAQAGFRVNQFSIFLARPLEACPPAAQATSPVELVEEPLAPASTWETETWVGLTPLQTKAWRGETQVGQITWALLPDLLARRGHLVGSIAALSVSSECRRQGIAKALVLEAMRQCYLAGAREITVATTQDNTAALQTYYACGFMEKEILLGHERSA
jgi:GNAT superfamily N-acetyltransferase